MSSVYYIPSLAVSAFNIYLYFNKVLNPVGFILFLISCGVFGLSLGLFLSTIQVKEIINASTTPNVGKKPTLDLDKVNKIKRTVFELQKAGYDVDLSDEACVLVEGVPFKLIKLKAEGETADGMVFKPISTTESEA
jgi:hypothetical protein